MAGLWPLFRDLWLSPSAMYGKAAFSFPILWAASVSSLCSPVGSQWTTPHQLLIPPASPCKYRVSWVIQPRLLMLSELLICTETGLAVHIISDVPSPMISVLWPLLFRGCSPVGSFCRNCSSPWLERWAVSCQKWAFLLGKAGISQGRKVPQSVFLWLITWLLTLVCAHSQAVHSWTAHWSLVYFCV